MKLTIDHLLKVAGGNPTADQRANMRSIVAGLDAYGEETGINTAQRLTHYVAQIAHESGRFVYDREIWGPTPAQRRYEGRADLGNTQPGDGSKFRGYGPIQLTGRDNVERFHLWCRRRFPYVPDFELDPRHITTDPWEGLSAIWYWHVGNPTGRSLNVLADENNIEMLTRRINGGLNGFADRCALYTRASLVLLGYELTRGAIGRFQKDAGIKVDDIDGPKTRAALHAALGKLPKEAPAPVPVAPPMSYPDPEDPTTRLNLIDLAVIRDATARIEARLQKKAQAA